MTIIKIPMNQTLEYTVNFGKEYKQHTKMRPKAKVHPIKVTYISPTVSKSSSICSKTTSIDSLSPDPKKSSMFLSAYASAGLQILLTKKY